MSTGSDTRDETDRRPWHPELRDEDWLRSRYLEDGMSPIAIAEELECSVPHVMRWIGQHRLETARLDRIHGRRRGPRR